MDIQSLNVTSEDVTYELLCPLEGVAYRLITPVVEHISRATRFV